LEPDFEIFLFEFSTHVQPNFLKMILLLVICSHEAKDQIKTDHHKDGHGSSL